VAEVRDESLHFVAVEDHRNEGEAAFAARAWAAEDVEHRSAS
jgi:hypothetical protein